MVSILTPKVQGGQFNWEETETVSLLRSSESFMLIPVITLEAGSYIVQMALKDSPHDLQEDMDYTWKLDIAPNREEKECPIVIDDTKTKFVQVTTLKGFRWVKHRHCVCDQPSSCVHAHEIPNELHLQDVCAGNNGQLESVWKRW